MRGMAKVVFMGTPDFAVPTLRKLIKTQTVVGVVTQPDRPAGRGRQLRPSPIKLLAQENNIPIYQPKSLRKLAAAETLQAWQPDVIVVAAFGQILRPHVLDLPPHGCINVHASLLPRWRGAAPIQSALMAGDAETGVTLMQMDPGLDTGPTYVAEAIPIHADETAATLHDRLSILGGEMLARYLADILAGNISAVPQDDSLSTYAPMLEKELGRLDWKRSSVELERHIRAMTPWPGAFTTWNGEVLKILAADIEDKCQDGQPGKVILKNDQLIVLCGNGGLALDTIQLAGKRAMQAPDFVRGRQDFVGAVLGAKG